jgi:GNAT superfamily N-acetyltransferase
VVAPGFLQNPEVRRWLNGVVPAWTMLDFNNLNALRHEPSGSNRAIRPEPDLANAEISGSAVAANTLVLLRRAAETGGLKLTATGNLSRAVVEEMCGIIKAPGYDKTELLRVQKVINEPDVLPLHFVRILAQAAKLIRTHRGKLIPTPLGRRLLAAEQHGPLQALLFHVAFWHMNFAYFDGYPLASWPLTQVGVILWSLSASANDWLPRETLTRLCASPVIGVLESQWDFRSSAMEARILRPLVWFGLLESRSEPRSPTEVVDRRLYRKAPLFDRFVQLNVEVEGSDRAIKGCTISAPEGEPSRGALPLGRPHRQFCRHPASSPRLGFDNISIGPPEGSAVSVPQHAAATAQSRREVDLSAEIIIRPFADADASQVRELFITVNRLLSPPDLRDAFEAYIERALAEEIDRIPAYYAQRDGGFWVATQDSKLVGTFGLERASYDAMELRRMYVDPGARRRGIARQMLRFAEDECRERNISKIELSTSELQNAALTFYKNAGYHLVYEELAQTGSNKTVGSGIRRFYFEKPL